MKKITAILTALALLLTLFVTGCNNNEKPKEESSKNSSTSSKVEVPTGNYKGNTYTNDYFEIKIDLDSEWTYKNEEELKAVNKLTADTITNEDIKEILDSKGAFIDMYATKSDMLNTVNVTVEKSITQGGTGTPQDYANYAVANLENVLENNGIIVDSIVADNVTLAGNEHPAVRIKGSRNSNPLEELVVVLKKDDYFCCITFVSYTGADLNALAATVEKV